jgi:nucleotide-binding universal stress UspA family protein
MASFSCATGHLSPVLAAVDFSRHSRRALVYAARLAQLLERPLVVLHVADGCGQTTGVQRQGERGGTQARPLLETARSLLDELLESVRASHPDLGELDAVRMGVVTGSPARRIVEMAEHCDAAMVVVGSRGLRGLASWWQGSVSQAVTRNCRRSVVVVHDRFSHDNRMPAASIGRQVPPLGRAQTRSGGTLGAATAA